MSLLYFVVSPSVGCHCHIWHMCGETEWIEWLSSALGGAHSPHVGTGLCVPVTGDEYEFVLMCVHD